MTWWPGGQEPAGSLLPWPLCLACGLCEDSNSRGNCDGHEHGENALFGTQVVADTLAKAVAEKLFVETLQPQLLHV